MKKLSNNKKLKHIFAFCLIMILSICMVIPMNTQAAVSSKEPIFKYLAPKSQTSYKQIYKSSQKVKKIKKDGKDIIAFGGTVMAAGAVITPKAGKIGMYVSAAGGAYYLVGDVICRSLSKIPNNAKSVVIAEFKWTDTKNYPLKGTFKYTTYYTYKGKVVGKKQVKKQNRQFSLGERW